MKNFLVLMLLFVTSAGWAAPTTVHPFALVMIDDASESRYGGFPVDRALVAQAVDKLAAAGARAVVLKFFYDLPSNSASDAALASAIGKTRVLLQARVDDSEARPNRIPDRFAVNVPAGPVAISGKSGWVPLPLFSNRAHNIGLVDVTSADRVPAYERLADKNYLSLTVATLSVALGDAPLAIQPAKQLRIGQKSIVLDDKSQIVLSQSVFDDADNTPYFSFADVVDGKASLQSLRGKVVVIGYHGSKMQSISTRAGAIKAHLAFWLGLLDAWAQLQ